MVERTAAAAFGAALHVSRLLQVPIFPLPGAILFPRAQLPLHIFETRYREMVREGDEVERTTGAEIRELACGAE